MTTQFSAISEGDIESIFDFSARISGSAVGSESSGFSCFRLMINFGRIRHSLNRTVPKKIEPLKKRYQDIPKLLPGI